MRCAPSRSAIPAAALLLAIWLPSPVETGAAVDDRVATALTAYLAQPRVPHQYSAARRLEAAGLKQRGWLEARTDFAPASGFAYAVTAEGGSGYIRAKVLRSLLDEEQRLIARGGSPAIAITTDNYRFTPEGVGDEGLAVVRMQPLRADRSLIAGRMFLNADGDLVRVEGQLAKSPSFWVTRVRVVRSYRRVGGVLMPVALETAAQMRWLGSSSLRMTYRYTEVDLRPVDDEPAEGWGPDRPARLDDRLRLPY